MASLLLFSMVVWAVQFLDVLDKNGRSIHAVAIHFADSLPHVSMVHGSRGALAKQDTKLIRGIQFSKLPSFTG
jgi:hypothetical protein